jgi:hypothetical protein
VLEYTMTAAEFARHHEDEERQTICASSSGVIGGYRPRSHETTKKKPDLSSCALCGSVFRGCISTGTTKARNHEEENQHF